MIDCYPLPEPGPDSKNCTDEMWFPNRKMQVWPAPFPEPMFSTGLLTAERRNSMQRTKTAASKACDRHDDRYSLSDAWLDWTDPTGRAWTFQVLDLSRRGVCVGVVGQEVVVPEVGELNDAVLRIGGLKIRGRVIVAQSTQSLSRGTVYGGEFFPASAEDERHFHAVIVALERRPRFEAPV